MPVIIPCGLRITSIELDKGISEISAPVVLEMEQHLTIIGCRYTHRIQGTSESNSVKSQPPANLPRE